MGILFDQIETDNQIVIRWSRILLFYIGALFVIIILFMFLHAPDPVRVVALFAPAGIQLWDTREIRPMITRANERGALQTSGSRFSLTDPLTVVIDKSKIL